MVSAKPHKILEKIILKFTTSYFLSVKVKKIIIKGHVIQAKTAQKDYSQKIYINRFSFKLAQK